MSLIFANCSAATDVPRPRHLPDDGEGADERDGYKRLLVDHLELVGDCRHRGECPGGIALSPWGRAAVPMRCWIGDVPRLVSTSGEAEPHGSCAVVGELNIRAERGGIKPPVRPLVSRMDMLREWLMILTVTCSLVGYVFFFDHQGWVTASWREANPRFGLKWEGFGLTEPKKNRETGLGYLSYAVSEPSYIRETHNEFP